MIYDTIDAELLRAERIELDRNVVEEIQRYINAYGDEIVTMPITANGTATVSSYANCTTAHGHVTVDDTELESLESLVARIPDIEPHRSHAHTYTYNPQTYTVDYVNEPHITSNTYPYTGSYWEIDPGIHTVKWDQGGSFRIEREPKKQMTMPNRDELMDFLADE